MAFLRKVINRPNKLWRRNSLRPRLPISTLETFDCRTNVIGNEIDQLDFEDEATSTSEVGRREFDFPDLNGPTVSNEDFELEALSFNEVFAYGFEPSDQTYNEVLHEEFEPPVNDLVTELVNEDFEDWD